MPKPLPAYTGDEPYVFVSYAHTDAAALKEIRALQDQGVNVWYDQGINPGSEWSNELARAISGCERFVYLITPRSVDSENCRQELNFALQERRPVLAVHLEETDVPQGLRLRLSHRQAIFKPKLGEAAYRNALLQAVRAQQTLGEDEREQFKSSSRKRGIRTAAIVGTVVVAVSLIGVSGRWLSRQAPAGGPKTVAVLPFTDLTPTGELGWLATGLSVELSNLISRFPGASIVPRALVAGHTASDLPMHVDYVLDGSVQQRGDGVAANVQLIEMPSGKQLWSQSFAGTRDDPYELQQQIASRVSGYFVESILGSGAFADVPPLVSGPQKPEARAAYFNFLQYSWSGDTEQGDFWLERTLQLDPTWAAGYLRMAGAYPAGSSSPEDRKRVEKARAALEQARRLGLENNPLFWRVEGGQLWRLDGDLSAAEQHFRRSALAGQPSDYLDLMLQSGLSQEIEPMLFAQAQQFSWWPLTWYELGLSRAINGDLEGAYLALRKLEDRLSPDASGLPYLFLLYSVLTETGRLDEVRERLHRINEPNARHALQFGIALATHDTAAALQLAERAAREGDHMNAAMNFLRLGDPRAEAEFALAAKTYDRGFVGLAIACTPPDLRGSRPFRNFLDTLGFTKAWRLELCQRASALPPETGIHCDPTKYQLADET